jgi:hypothetical protein
VRTLKHPLTLYPALLGAGSAAAVAALHAGAVAELLAIGGLGLGATSLFVNLVFRQQSFKSAELEEAAQRIREEEKRIRRLLERELEVGREISGCGDLSEQALQQLDRLATTRKSLNSILRDKLNEGELTFARYASSAESIIASIETNLRAVATRFKSLQSIDVEAAKDGLRRLKRKGEFNTLPPEDQQESKALEGRLALLSEEAARIGSILKINEQAITQLDQTVISVAGMRTGKGDASDLGAAIRDLEDLADRAKRFDINKAT